MREKEVKKKVDKIFQRDDPIQRVIDKQLANSWIWLLEGLSQLRPGASIIKALDTAFTEGRSEDEGTEEQSHFNLENYPAHPSNPKDWLEDILIEAIDRKREKSKQKRLDSLVRDGDWTEEGIAKELKISIQAVNAHIKKSTSPKILKEFRKFIKEPEKKDGNIPNSRRKWRMMNIKPITKLKELKVKISPQYFASLEGYKSERRLTLRETIEDILSTKERWRELEEHFPPERLKDVTKFIKDLFINWEISGTALSRLSSENRKLKEEITSLRDLIGKERMGLIDRAIGHHKAKSTLRRQQVKDGVMSAWEEDEGPKVFDEINLGEPETE